MKKILLLIILPITVQSQTLPILIEYVRIDGYELSFKLSNASGIEFSTVMYSRDGIKFDSIASFKSSVKREVLPIKESGFYRVAFYSNGEVYQNSEVLRLYRGIEIEPIQVWNLQGVETKLEYGNSYILKQGNKTSKVTVK